MPIVTNCPSCQSKFELQDQLAGQQVQCQNCNQVFIAPQPNVAATTPQPSKPAPPASSAGASGGSFGSVFDQVSTPATSAPSQPSYGDPNYGQQQSGYAGSSSFEQPAYGGYEKQTGGGGKGLIIGAIVAGSLLLLGGIGFGLWYFLAPGGDNDKSIAGAPAGFDDPFNKTKSERDDEFREHVAEMQKSSDNFEKQLKEKFGTKVAKITVSGVKEISAANITSMLSEGIKLTNPFEKPMDIICSKKGRGTYEIHCGPVPNVKLLASKIPFGTVTDTKLSPQEIFVTVSEAFNDTVRHEASIASSRPGSRSGSRNGADSEDPFFDNAKDTMDKIRDSVEDDIASMDREMEKERDRIMSDAGQRQKEREMEQALRDADRSGKPRPGESIPDWIERHFDTDSLFEAKDFLKQLARMEPDPDLLDTVAARLIEYQEDQETSNLDETLDAMLKWRTEATDRHILSMVGNSTYRLHGKPLMKALKDLGTEEAAVKLAVALPDFFSGEGSVNHLISMGDVAEDAVLNYIRHDEPKVRTRVYKILYEIGTPKSMETLKTNRGMEKDKTMKEQVKSVIDAITARHPEIE